MYRLFVFSSSGRPHTPPPTSGQQEEEKNKASPREESESPGLTAMLASKEAEIESQVRSKMRTTRTTCRGINILTKMILPD